MTPEKPQKTHSGSKQEHNKQQPRAARFLFFVFQAVALVCNKTVDCENRDGTLKIEKQSKNNPETFRKHSGNNPTTIQQHSVVHLQGTRFMLE
ncbi:MAG: hypothetical protein ABFD03_05385 [Clostridiaceae bacterium]